MRILLIPPYAAIKLAAAITNLIVRLSDWVFYVFGGLMLLTTVLCYYMQIESGEGLRKMIIGSGSMFLIPMAASMATGVLEAAGEILGDRVWKAK